MGMKLKPKTGTALVRHAAVAGQFYPDDPQELRADVERFLAAAKAVETVPKAVIAPHAGYFYSGPIAGSAYAGLARGRDSIRRVVLLGPSHHVAFAGLATSSAEAFESPLGRVPVDMKALDLLLSRLPQVTTRDEAHRHEHSLEVQLPFLQVALGEFQLVPLVVGDATAAAVGEVLDTLWGGAETCIVVSSDLSHYLNYKTAQQTDSATARSIEALDWARLEGEQACGCRPIRGLLKVAKERGLCCRTVNLRNSGDTAGRRDRVVGYGAFVFTEG